MDLPLSFSAGGGTLGGIFGDAGFDWGNLAGSVLGTGADLLGKVLGGAVSSGAGGGAAPGLDSAAWLSRLVSQGGSSIDNTVAGYIAGQPCGPDAFFEPVPATGIRAKREVVVENPVNGKLVYFINRGHPVLFSGDYAACKRVSKVAARAGRGRRKSGRRC